MQLSNILRSLYRYMTVSATFHLPETEFESPAIGCNLPKLYIDQRPTRSSFCALFPIQSDQFSLANMPFAVKALDHVVLTCKNIPATVKFYSLLGMKHESFRSSKDAPGVER